MISLILYPHLDAFKSSIYRRSPENPAAAPPIEKGKARMTHDQTRAATGKRSAAASAAGGSVGLLRYDKGLDIRRLHRPARAPTSLVFSPTHTTAPHRHAHHLPLPRSNSFIHLASAISCSGHRRSDLPLVVVLSRTRARVPPPQPHDAIDSAIVGAGADAPAPSRGDRRAARRIGQARARHAGRCGRRKGTTFSRSHGRARRKMTPQKRSGR